MPFSSNKNFKILLVICLIFFAEIFIFNLDSNFISTAPFLVVICLFLISINKNDKISYGLFVIPVFIADLFGAYKLGLMTASFLLAVFFLKLIGRWLNFEINKKYGAVFTFIGVVFYYASIIVFNKLI